MRKLLDGSEAPEEAAPVAMAIESRCPGKWAFVDLETGDVWEWHGGEFRFRRPPAARLRTIAAVTRALWERVARAPGPRTDDGRPDPA